MPKNNSTTLKCASKVINNPDNNAHGRVIKSISPITSIGINKLKTNILNIKFIKLSINTVLSDFYIIKSAYVKNGHKKSQTF